MNATDKKLEEYLSELALKAILKHPDSKRYAKVNHDDNFVLAVFHVAHDVIMKEIIDFADDPHDVVWFNAMCGTQLLIDTKFNAFIKTICLTAYQKLR